MTATVAILSFLLLASNVAVCAALLWVAHAKSQRDCETERQLWALVNRLLDDNALGRETLADVVKGITRPTIAEAIRQAAAVTEHEEANARAAGRDAARMPRAEAAPSDYQPQQSAQAALDRQVQDWEKSHPIVANYMSENPQTPGLNFQ